MAYVKRETKEETEVKATRGRPRVVKEDQEVSDVVTMSEETVEQDEIKETVKSSTVTKSKTYSNDDLIPCRSIVQGFLNFKGRKSDTVYQWEAVNDVTNVEYQDLKAAMLSRAVHVMRPYFVIEDEELLSLPEWSDVKKLYENMYSKSDLTDIFKISSVDRMAQVLNSLPDGVKSQMGNIAKEMMERGTLDSIKKIKKIDEILGTDLKLFMIEN